MSRVATSLITSLAYLAVALFLWIASVHRARLVSAETTSDPFVSLERLLAPPAPLAPPDDAPTFLQQQDNSCGPAALAYLLTYLGAAVTESEVAEITDIQAEGTSMASLAAAAGRLGFDAWGERQTVSALEAETVPVIAVVHQNHYVTVVDLDDRWASVFDPAVGFGRLPRQTFLAGWQGYVLKVVPRPIPEDE